METRLIDNSEKLNVTGLRPLEAVTCCRDVREHREPVELSFAPELKCGYLLDDRFRILEPLSRSGMAVVYLAEDAQQENRTVAVKVPHLKLESDPGFFSRFQREEEIGHKLNHPYILKFIPVDGRKKRPYIAMEYLRGSTLAHLMESTRPLPEKDALKITSLICEALQHMHWRGVIHRDLKPSNIMLCCDHTIRLMDFGIASDTSARRITLTRMAPTIGTPDYMAPEQVSHRHTDERTDIYSLGVVLYEMLTGCLPFQHENPWVAMNHRVTGDPVAPRKLNPNISPEAEEIVLHAMRRESGDRYQSAAALKVELDAPETVPVTGYCHRLEPPRWKLGMRETPVIAGTLIGLGFILFQVLLFLLIMHLLAK
jgi:serine/threonine-protein kinase